MSDVEARRCAYQPCSRPLTLRPGEKPWQLRRRTCCDASCANRKARNSTTPVDLPVSKICEECGATTHQHEGESPSRWEARRFCSQPCASRNTLRPHTKRAAAPASKPCAQCGQTMWRRPGERTNRWDDRECCSLSCASRLKARRAKRGAAGTFAPRKPAAKRPPKPKPAPKPEPAPAPPTARVKARPQPARVLDPDVADMDRRRRAALRMLDQGAVPERVATAVGVSLGQVRRWDDGMAS